MNDDDIFKGFIDELKTEHDVPDNEENIFLGFEFPKSMYPDIQRYMEKYNLTKSAFCRRAIIYVIHRLEEDNK